MDGWSLVTEATPQLSDVAGVAKVTVALHCPVVLFTILSAGQVIDGSSSSVTLTLKLVVAVLLF